MAGRPAALVEPFRQGRVEPVPVLFDRIDGCSVVPKTEAHCADQT
jgi:hypothetical protein